MKNKQRKFNTGTIRNSNINKLVPITYKKIASNNLTSEERKQCPVYSGFIKYFPNAVISVANHSFIANQKHNPGEKLHWDKEKSTDEKDAELRHLIDVAKGNEIDENGLYALTAKAWRAMADLEREILKTL
jgi:hypothetical protein